MALDIFSVFFRSGGKRSGFNCDTVCKRVLSNKDCFRKEERGKLAKKAYTSTGT